MVPEIFPLDKNLLIKPALRLMERPLVIWTVMVKRGYCYCHSTSNTVSVLMEPERTRLFNA
jgi:hypothetical protein